ncbi:MAG TPA: hypothetical protein VM098_07125 [Phycisphaerae bacterium]|nr:hypothetical protein [Phycisphaerae bacterium]
MAEGHGRDRWSRTALLCALIANSNRDPRKGRAFHVEDFDPYSREQSHEIIEVTPETVGFYRQAFTGQKGKHHG